MPLRIDNDHNRFKEIVRGKIKQNLRKYMSSSDMVGRKGKELISIPIPRIDIPRFTHDPQQGKGVGQGDGNPGDTLGQGADGDPAAGQGGNQPGQHMLEVDVSLDELAQILAEELELPRIEPRGQKQNISAYRDKYTGIRPVGPESLRHFKRTYREALKRQIAAGSYDKHNPNIVPVKSDMRYRSWKTVPMPTTNAVILYLMDVSGSMGSAQKEIVRTESFWIDTWLRSQYKGVESRYIIHDAAAREVDQETFYHTRESGGTIISTAYRLVEDILTKDYNPMEWNIYIFHFSDGDNWSSEDTSKCFDILRESLLPNVNLFCYGQVESQYGSGQFLKDLESHLSDEENLITSQIENKEAIYDSIKTFLGKGK